MLDFFLIYPLAFVLGIAAAFLATSLSKASAIGLAFVLGALLGSGAFLAYHLVIDSLPNDLLRAFLSAAFPAAAFAAIGTGVVIALRWFIYLLSENS